MFFLFSNKLCFRGKINKGHLLSENVVLDIWSVSHTSSVALNVYMLRSPFSTPTSFSILFIKSVVGWQKEGSLNVVS